MTTYRNRNRIKEYLKNQFNLPDEQIESMVPSFLKTLQGHLQKLEEAMDAGELERVSSAGHTLKGALLNLGLHNCAGIANTVENISKDGVQGAELNELVETLRREIKSLIE